MFAQFGDDDYDNMGEEDYDEYSNQYKKSKDRGRGESGPEGLLHVLNSKTQSPFLTRLMNEVAHIQPPTLLTVFPRG